MPPPTSSPNPHPEANPLSLGIAGCGKVVEIYHLPALAQSGNWRLTAACDPSRQRLAWLRQSMPEIPVYQTLDAMLDQEKLDALLITSPPAFHGSLAIEALNRGLHVLVEKPLALNSRDAKEMLQSARDNQRILRVGFTRRYRQPYRHLQQILAQSNHDQIKTIHFRLLLDSGNWGAVSGYLGDDKAGGGIWDDVLSHQVDLLLRLVSKPATEVRAADNTGTVTLRLRFNHGLEAECEAGHGDRYVEELLVEISNRRILAHAAGILAVPPALSLPWLKTFGRVQTFLHLALHKITGKANITRQSFINQLDDFAAAIRIQSEVPLDTDHHQDLQVVQIIEAARKSAAEGGSWQAINPQKKE